MIPYTVYKVVHLSGLFMVIMGLAGLLLVRMAGTEPTKSVRKLAAITHGIGLMAVLVSGFGMLAGVSPFPYWAVGKLLVWLFLGGEIALVLRKPSWAGMLWWITIAASGFAVYLVVYKPGG